MESPPPRLEKMQRVQQLVVDISRVSRNHQKPGTDESESVVDHCFATAMLCWQIQAEFGLCNLDQAKVFKYVMVHDLLERGLAQDFNAYSSPFERGKKAAYEQDQMDKISAEFSDFGELVLRLRNYGAMIDDEAHFVWTVEKMQAVVLDEMDDWRAHKAIGASYDDYCSHHGRLLERCFPPLRELFAEVIEHGRQNFYDQPS